MLADSPKLLVTENTGVTFKGAQSKRAQDILRPMLMYEIDSLSTLGARWRADPKFLLVSSTAHSKTCFVVCRPSHYRSVEDLQRE